jgi:hypothetical protein
MPCITYIWTTFVKATFSKFIIFRVKSIFEPNVFKWVIKANFISSSPSSLLIINVKIIYNFQKKWAHLVLKKHLEKTRIIKFLGLSVLKHFLFVSSFEHVNFAINEKDSKNIYDNSNYYVSLVIFQTYKNAILRIAHSFRWFL